MFYNVYIDSSNLQCKLNAIQTFQTIKYLEKNGHTVQDSIDQSDFIIVATCGFIKDYEDLSKNLLKNLCNISRKESIVIGIGCLSKINNNIFESNEKNILLLENLEDLDKYFFRKIKYKDIKKAYFDKTQFANIFDLKKMRINKYIEYKVVVTKKLLAKLKWKKFRIIEKIFNEATSENKVYVQISSGCKQNCSYCIIKKAKGKLASRSINEILSDIKEIWSPGKILALTGDECGGYGLDINTTLFDLVETITKNFQDIPIDLVYIYPGWLEKYPDQYVKMFKNNYIYSANIPIQSGSQKILKLMNRDYNITKILKILKKLRKESPGTFFWTHFLVGFSNESWKDFFKTLAASLHFHYFYIFKYTPRSGTVSYNLPDNISSIKKSIRRLISIIVRNFIYLFNILGLIK